MAKTRKPPKTDYGNAAADDDFCQWWIAYPRKVSKMSAYKAWTKAVDGIAEVKLIKRKFAVQWLLRKTVEFAASDLSQNHQFCPYPATWLNGARFDDDPAEWNVGGRVRALTERDIENWRP